MTRRTLVRVAALLAVVALLVVAETQLDLPDSDSVRAYFEGLGWIALPGFALFYAGATLLPLPKAVCTIAGGAIFGFWAGLAVVLAGAVAGSTLAFALSRWLGRRSVRDLGVERIRRLDEQIGRRGLVAVLVARLVPVVPFTTINYAFGLTSVTLRSYVVATTVGIIPGTAVYVAVGAYGFSPGSWPFAIAIVGLVLLSIVGVMHRRRTRDGGVTSDGTDGAAHGAA
ncbi:TVP38/TMEM64 family protein [Cytobacillus oceanisediminis]